MEPSADYVPVFEASGLPEADLIRGLLVAHGFPALIEGEETVVVLDGMVTGNRGVRVLVPGTDLEAAASVIREARDAGATGDGEEE